MTPAAPWLVQATRGPDDAATLALRAELEQLRAAHASKDDDASKVSCGQAGKARRGGVKRRRRCLYSSPTPPSPCQGSTSRSLKYRMPARWICTRSGGLLWHAPASFSGSHSVGADAVAYPPALRVGSARAAPGARAHQAAVRGAAAGGAGPARGARRQEGGPRARGQRGAGQGAGEAGRGAARLLYQEGQGQCGSTRVGPLKLGR